MIRHVLAVCWFVVFAILLSYPLVLDPGGQIPGSGPGDNVAFLWNFWWFRQALAEPSLSAFYTDRIFAPFGTSLVLHTHTALPAVVGATVLAPVTVAAAHNIVLLGGLAANGAMAYALAYHRVRDALASVLAGVVFAGSAYVSIHLLGHFNLVHAWVLPLAALAWIRCMEAPTLTRGAAAGLAFAAAAYTDYYYLAFSLLLAPWWMVLRVVRIGVHWGRSRWPRIERVLLLTIAAIAAVAAVIALTGGGELAIGSLRVSASSTRNPLAACWLLVLAWMALRLRLDVRRAPDSRSARSYIAPLATAAIVWLAAILPLAIPAVALILAGDYVTPPLMWRSGPRGVDAITLALGHPLNLLYGGATRGVYARLGIDMMEQVGWVGFAPLVVLVHAVARRLALDDWTRRWIVVAAFFGIWSFGTYLTVAGVDTGIPLPQALTRYVPLLSNARMPGRAFIVFQLATAMLCAVAVARGRWSRPAIVALVAIAIADGVSLRVPMYRLPGEGQIDATLAAAPGRLAIAEVPVGIRDGFGEVGRFDHRALVHQISHGQPIVGGFVARLPARVRNAYVHTPALMALLNANAADSTLPDDFTPGLAEAGVTHVVVNTDAIARPLRDNLEAGGMRLVMIEGPRELYLVVKKDEAAKATSSKSPK